MKTFVFSCIIVLLFTAAPIRAQQIVHAVRVPDHGIQPQAAVDAKGIVHLIYLTGDAQASDIWYVSSKDDGTTFSKPIRVNAHPGSALAFGTIRGPHMALGRNGIVHVAWMGSNESMPKFGGAQPTMLYSRLGKDGRFEPEKGLISKYSGLDGGGSIAADDKGNVYVAWHAPSVPRGDESTRHVFITRSEDDGQTFLPEEPVAGKSLGACACCGIRLLAPAGGGKIVGIYRTATKQVHRDTRAFVIGDDLKVPRASATIDPMNSAVCLMSTYALADARGGNSFIAAWETSGQVRIGAFSYRTLEAEQPLDLTGKAVNQKHPAIAIDAQGNVLVAWAVGTGWNRGGVVAWQVYDRNLLPVPNTAGRVEGLPAWSRPAALANSRGGFLVLY